MTQHSCLQSFCGAVRVKNSAENLSVRSTSTSLSYSDLLSPSKWHSEQIQLCPRTSPFLLGFFFFSFYNSIKRRWMSACPICQAFLLEAPDTPVHRSWTQLKRAICVKFMMSTLHHHWLTAHQTPPLSPLLVQRGPWEVSGHFLLLFLWFISLIAQSPDRDFSRCPLGVK